MTKKKEKALYVNIPDAEYVDVRVEWPLVGTQGVIIDEEEIVEETMEEIAEMRPQWMTDNLVTGGVFLDAEPQQMWEIDQEEPVVHIVAELPKDYC